jgi:hypothetical protein
MIPNNLRTGFVSSDVLISADNGLSTNIKALMALFVEDAMRVAGECAIASDRRIVSEDDMKNALKYVAQVFFSTADLEERFNAAVTRLHEEGEDDNDDDDDDDEEGEECSGEADSDGATESSPSQRAWDEKCDLEADTVNDVVKYRHTKRLVQQAVQNWTTWDPTDDAQILIKHAIEKSCE